LSDIHVKSMDRAVFLPTWQPLQSAEGLPDSSIDLDLAHDQENSKNSLQKVLMLQHRVISFRPPTTFSLTPNQRH
jgi:hypothetical protein